MMTTSILDHKRNIFSQNGEDGVIERVFELVGVTTRTCCEFGAWDGIHLSNCRHLILRGGWTALMIEGDEDRFHALRQTYADNARVSCLCRYVDTKQNRLLSICNEVGIKNLDFLSIDIDGFDYELFRGLDISPRVVCVEVNAAHPPEHCDIISKDIAKNNVGQPLSLFTDVAKKKGYSLVCYTGNAFYVRNDVLKTSCIPVLSDEAAYGDFLRHLSVKEREWLYLVNLGLVPPYHRFKNPHLHRSSLDIGGFRATKIYLKALPAKFRAVFRFR